MCVKIPLSPRFSFPTIMGAFTLPCPRSNYKGRGSFYMCVIKDCYIICMLFLWLFATLVAAKHLFTIHH